jgi:DNA-binding transcriptional LysR family regulator
MIKELPNIKKSFIRLENLISSIEKDISGSLRITTVSDYSAMLNPALKEFRTAYPKLRIHIIATDVVLSLAEGSAHVSLRVGPRPSEPDLIVKNLKAPGVYFCASDDYLEQYGIPKDASDYKNHLWALPSEEKRHIPFVQKILKHISEEQIIYQSNSFQDIHNAVIEGMAIGPMNGYLLEQNKHLNQLDIPIQQEDEGLWFVYHKDLKNSVRIKTLYDFLVKSLE